MALMADHIARAGEWTCTLAKDGEAIKGGHVYLAPGDLHMTVAGSSAVKKFRLTDDPPVNFAVRQWILCLQVLLEYMAIVH
jgi:two-component system chemotaxis response regulator CheB